MSIKNKKKQFLGIKKKLNIEKNNIY